MSASSSRFVPKMCVRRIDYYIITSRCGDRHDEWRWELRRKGKQLGVRLSGDGYRSDQAARSAGKEALDVLISAIMQEDLREKDG